MRQGTGKNLRRTSTSRDVMAVNVWGGGGSEEEGGERWRRSG